MESFGFTLLPRFFSKKSNVLSKYLFASVLRRTAFFLGNEAEKQQQRSLCNVFRVHQVKQLGGWWIWWTSFLLFSVSFTPDANKSKTADVTNEEILEIKNNKRRQINLLR